jgi:hypothetical protein
MTKKKEPTDSYYTVTLERQVTQIANVSVKVTARLDKTKKVFIKNSVDDLAERVPESHWVITYDDFPKVENIEKEWREGVCRCPHCHTIMGESEVIDLGEVDD